jgi:hypothetical protein
MAAAPAPEDPRKAALARFDALHKLLKPRLKELEDCEPHTLIITPGVPHVPVPNEPGVYLFTEDGEHRYVGRSKDLGMRLGLHTRQSSGHNSAPFAFNIARRDAEEAGFAVAGRTRADLGADAEFNEKYFAPAKVRVRKMEFRFVRFDPEEADVDVFSTIFEVYAAMALGTDGDFNLFHTH